VALHARRALCFQLLIYPAVDQSMRTESIGRNGEGYLLTRSLMECFRANYLPHPADYADWRASPALAKSHAGLPPALVITAGFDPLLDEGRQYAELWRAPALKSPIANTPTWCMASSSWAGCSIRRTPRLPIAARRCAKLSRK
jgi:acetyl esterase/lipase